MTLDELIPSYAEHKAEADRLEKLYGEENKQIKKLMGDNGEKTVGKYTATTSSSQRQSMDMETLCKKLSKYEWAYQNDIIKVKEYVDEDALEEALYKKEGIPDGVIGDIDSCRKITNVVTLRIKENKKNG